MNHKLALLGSLVLGWILVLGSVRMLRGEIAISRSLEVFGKVDENNCRSRRVVRIIGTFASNVELWVGIVTKRMITNIDLTTLTGTLKLVPAKDPLPRRDKQQLELRVAWNLITGIQTHTQHKFSQPRSNPDDPPDVLVEMDDEIFGIELTEVLPPNRLEKDHIIKAFRKKVLDKLETGHRTRDIVVDVFLHDANRNQFHPKKNDKVLAETISEGLRKANDAEHWRIDVPKSLQDFVAKIGFRRQDLTNDWRIADRDHPLINFDVQNTTIIVEDDVPLMVDKALRSKCRMRLGANAWLLVWYEHPAITSIQKEISLEIDQFRKSNEIPFDEIFLLNMSREPKFIHFPVNGQSKVQLPRK